MAENPTKPKRDLRARLGRTITSKSAEGDDAAAAESTDVAAASAPATETPEPAVKAPAVRPALGPVSAPPPAFGLGGGVTAPPFAKPEVAAPPFAVPSISQPSQPSAPEKVAASADPFGSPSGAAVQQNVVRLEFDDKLVTDQEVGKGQKVRGIVISLVVLAVGIGVGWGAGSLLSERRLFQRNVDDARSIRESVDEASRSVTSAQTHINAIVTAARGDQANGTAPRVDYSAVEAIRALEKPIDANAFIGKNYNALPPATVNDLMVYTMNVERLWNDFRALATETLPEQRRAELDRTATEMGEAATTQYGAVLQRTEDGQLAGAIAFLQPQPAQEGQPPRVAARLTRGGAPRDLQLYTGAEPITATATHVLLIDGQQSRGALAEQLGAFGRFVQRLMEIKTLLDQTVEVQGRLLQSLNQVLTEVGAGG
jgi:hypothetical protein